MTFWLNNSTGSIEFIDPAAASAWDTLFLGVWWLPGLCSVEVKTAVKIDVAMPTAMDGASLRFMGAVPAPVQIRVMVWTEEQFNELSIILQQIDPRQRKTLPPPLQIRHPKTALAKIVSVVPQEIDWFADGPSPQIKISTISTIQYFKPRAIAPAGTLNLPTVAPTQTAPLPSSSAAKRGP